MRDMVLLLESQTMRTSPEAVSRDVSRTAVAFGLGYAVLFPGHLLFRVTHVLWTAHDLDGVAPLHQAVYLLGQYLLPFFLWLLIASRSARIPGEAR